MVETLTLSPSAVALLEMIEQQAGISFEVVHLRLDAVRRSPTGDLSRRMDEVEIADEVLKALRTGEVPLRVLSGASSLACSHSDGRVRSSGA